MKQPLNMRTIIIMVLFAIAISIAITQYRESHPAKPVVCVWGHTHPPDNPFPPISPEAIRWQGDLKELAKELDGTLPIETIDAKVYALGRRYAASQK
jgi:hypothetical protein